MARAIDTRRLRGELTEDVPMARLTSWRVGGPAERLYRPADVDDLALFLSLLPADEPLTWIGLGSNLLVRDGGVRGTVIALHGMLDELELIAPGVIRAGAGVPCAKVARFAAKNGLVGGEFLAGIPGTMGGALAMNAGAFGGETWEKVARVETLDRQGRRHVRMADEYRIGYRSVQGPAEEWFTACELVLATGDGEASQARIRELLNRRGETQPTGLPSCGSVFRNPPGDHAGRLIEACGLKGHCIGGACVSEKHANFIINTGDATARDIEALIAHVQATVAREHGIELIAEVRVIGEEEGA
ncbi:MAG: UDP-N-acetylmuramate dehydrogenase [Gammaproteobacteria bacterium]|nr:UDP-N-acetylmuramate dehydrogenase [Gammaproteobacteria bacterium]